MAYQESVNLTTLTEAYLDENNKQNVLQYASAAARTADGALTAVLREGMLSALLDVNLLQVYTGGLWSTIGSWSTLAGWTPVVVQNGIVTVTTNGTAYSRNGRMVTAFGYLTVTGGSGVANNVVTISLPITADAGWVSDYTTLGYGFISDASASQKYEGAIVLASSTTMKIRSTSVSTSPPLFQGATSSGFTAALVNTDILSFMVMYPAAADG